MVDPFVKSIFPSLPFRLPASPEGWLSNADPFGNGFRFGESGEGLWMIPGSDIFRGGLCCTSMIRDLREPGTADEVEAGTDSRLTSANAVASGAEPSGRGWEEEVSFADAAAADVGETGEVREGRAA
jgi:hypothetical protein